MQSANAGAVVGDFNDASLAYGGVTSPFFRRDGKFMVRTDGPNGALHDYEIKFTFGVSPLAAVSHRTAGWAAPGARDRVGQPISRGGWPTMVPSLFQPNAKRRRLSALDWPRPKLELCAPIVILPTFTRTTISERARMPRPTPRWTLPARPVMALVPITKRGLRSAATGAVWMRTTACGCAGRAPRRHLEDRSHQRKRRP